MSARAREREKGREGEGERERESGTEREREWEREWERERERDRGVTGKEGSQDLVHCLYGLIVGTEGKGDRKRERAYARDTELQPGNLS